MKYRIKADEKMDYQLGETDVVKSVIQNCHLLLNTRKGSIPMYRDFGLDMDFRDRPMLVAQTMMISRVKEALETFEPRANVISITFEQNSKDPGAIIPILEVRINEQSI